MPHDTSISAAPVPWGTFERYMLRELCKPFLAGLMLFFVVACCGQILRSSDAATGLGLSSADFFRALVFATPPLLGLLLPITHLFSTLFVVGRMESDRESYVLAQAGRSPALLLRVPLAMGTALALIAMLALAWGEPWGIRGLRNLLTTSAQRALTHAVRGGHFHTWLPGVVFFAEDHDRHTGELLGLVVADRRDEKKPTVISAHRGALRQGERADELSLALSEGVALLGDGPGVDAMVHLVQFKRGSWRLNVGELVGQKVRSLSVQQELSLTSLWQQSRDPRESAANRALWTVMLHRKAAVPLACVVFALVAVPLGLSARGAARSRSFLLCTLLTVAYYYLGRALELSARSGQFNPVLAAWGPNGLGLCAAACLWYPKTSFSRVIRRGLRSRHETSCDC